MIQVLIQSTAGSSERQIYNEETLELQRTRHTALPHPYPYGFIPGTLADDGDCLDCFVVTSRPLALGALVACEPLGLLMMQEDGEDDHKVLAAVQGEKVVMDDALYKTLSRFLHGIFAENPETRLDLGGIASKEEALRVIRAAGLVN